MDAARPPDRAGTGLRRAAALLFRPGRTLDLARAEPARFTSMFLRYVAPLAAVGPVCGAIGLIVFGGGIAGLEMRLNAWPTLQTAALDYVVALVWIVAITVGVWALAPVFGAPGRRVEGLKTVAYACTPLWAAGVFALYPPLGLPMAVLGGLYSLYVLHLALEKVMGAPVERSLTYFVSVLGLGLLLALGLRLLRARIG